VKVQLLPSAPDSARQHLISFLIDRRLAVDAGCIGLWGTPQDQAAIRAVLLTHSHIDHVGSLPIFAMNVVDGGGTCARVYAPPPVIETLQQDLFNGRLWPDFTALKQDGVPLLTFEPIEPRQPFTVDGFAITAIPVNHPVPTVGYLIDDGRSAVLFATDTGPTEEIWRVASANPRLTAVFIDVAFPDAMRRWAEGSGHLTPRMALEELRWLPDTVRGLAVHLKASFHERLVEEVNGLRPSRLLLGQTGIDYEL
jgi:cAMP phosphodiesterase